MAFRGRGRGRFGGGGGAFYAKQEPFVPFPEIELPVKRTETKDDKFLVIMRTKLQNYWRESPYYLEETGPSVVGQSSDIDRYSDRGKPKIKRTRDSFMQFLEADASHFPKELLGDSRADRSKKRKTAQWNLDSGLKKLDMFEKLEQKYQGQEGKGENEKKEGEEEDKDDEEELGEDEEEVSSDGDYNQNVDFDDDEDDFNMGADDNDDEGEY